MGIFDNYQFDQNSYGGQDGGLLGLFRMMQSVPMQGPPGFPQQQPQIPPQALAAQASAPSQAAPAQPQTQPQAPPQLGMGDRLSAGFQGFANAGSPMQALGNLFGGLATGQRTDPVGMYQQNANQTEHALVSYGFNPGLAKVIAGNPDLMKTVLPHVMGIGGQTDDIKEYQFAKKEDPSLTFERFMARKKAVSGEYGMQPVYGTDAEGNTVVLQLGKSGDAKQSVMPPGVKLSAGVEKIDLGTEWGIIDKKTGNMVGRQPKDIAGRETQEKLGQAKGEAQVALPGAIRDAESTKTKIDQLLAHEGLDSIFGPLDQYRPSWLLGEKGRDAKARYNQLKGGAFLQAFGLLRGGGAITEKEGDKAEAAMARMDRALDEADFRTALKDFRDAIDSGVAKIRDKAGGASAPTAPPKSTTPTSVEDLVKKYK